MRQSWLPPPVFTLVCLLSASAASLSAQITATEYASRRDSLADHIGSGVVIALGGRTPVSDGGPFRQLPAFRYLTGYEYADAALVMIVRDGRPASTMFVHRTAPRRALYYGIEPDSAAIATELGLPSRPAGDLVEVADSLAALGMAFHTLRDFAAADFARADSLTRGEAFMNALEARYPGLAVSDAHPLVDRLRARKSEAELGLIRKAGEISEEGHRELMRRIGYGMHEYDLQAIVEATFLHLGAERPAYGTIVGSGPNATVLHYMKNRRSMQPGELVVIDAGAEYNGYAADITRTLPVSGTFTADQRALYQVVRDALAAAERNSGPGMSMPAAHDSTLDVQAKGLARLGLIEAADATFDPPWPADCERFPRSCRQVMLFTIHGITHGIGLEVHDPLQAYYDAGTFAVGDAFTIEPGVYVSARQLEVLPDTPRNRRFIANVRAAVERYEGTGIRIEDDYVITEEGLERITHVPRELDEIEALTRRGAPLP
jgi:Xaa-Pro aminopeptidase